MNSANAAGLDAIRPIVLKELSHVIARIVTAIFQKSFDAGKTMEHIIASSLTKHLNQNNILYDLQHGFRDRRPCETQLLQLIEALARNMPEGKQTDLILLDFSKALIRSVTVNFYTSCKCMGCKARPLAGLNLL